MAEAVIGPGDMVFIPADTWHHVGRCWRRPALARSPQALTAAVAALDARA